MLRRLKKFTVYSLVIVAGQATLDVDDATIPGEDESVSECDERYYVQIFGDCYRLDTTFLDLSYNDIGGPIPTEFGLLTGLARLRAHPPPAPARATAPRRRRSSITRSPARYRSNSATSYCYAKSGTNLVAPCGTTGCCDLDDGETCSSSGGGDACSGLAKKTCKKTAGCAYKKKTCISCSELSKKKCKKTDGCAYKKKTCISCSELSKKKCKETDGCEYKKKKDKCLAK
ncbi:hypothetical protein JL721_5406 [Aureococcus anophagefferens]|nr:hypothetical protein JL721_5406 [Aureococcus anophagefferens]